MADLVIARSTQPSPSLYISSFGSDQENQVRPVSLARGDSKVDRTINRQRPSRWGEPKFDVSGTCAPVSVTTRSDAKLDDRAGPLDSEAMNHELNLDEAISYSRERPPSPPPTYGQRSIHGPSAHINNLEDTKLNSRSQSFHLQVNFLSPMQSPLQKRSLRPFDKVYIPVKEFPQINFFGLLVGPRGNSLKKMERESGAKISIRGKGSVKEGKPRSDHLLDDAEEDLHCLVTADSEEKVAACVKMINNVIETAASTPEGQNDHKRHQLRELAALNGTLRDDEKQLCQNCGSIGHRKYECTVQRNFICRLCGNLGHLARDCLTSRSRSIASASMSGLATGSAQYAGGKLYPMAKTRECRTSVTGPSWDGTGQNDAVNESDFSPWGSGSYHSLKAGQSNVCGGGKNFSGKRAVPSQDPQESSQEPCRDCSHSPQDQCN